MMDGSRICFGCLSQQTATEDSERCRRKTCNIALKILVSIAIGFIAEAVSLAFTLGSKSLTNFDMAVKILAPTAINLTITVVTSILWVTTPYCIDKLTEKNQE